MTPSCSQVPQGFDYLPGYREALGLRAIAECCRVKNVTNMFPTGGPHPALSPHVHHTGQTRLSSWPISTARLHGHEGHYAGLEERRMCIAGQRNCNRGVGGRRGLILTNGAEGVGNHFLTNEWLTGDRPSGTWLKDLSDNTRLPSTDWPVHGSQGQRLVVKAGRGFGDPTPRNNKKKTKQKPTRNRFDDIRKLVKKRTEAFFQDLGGPLSPEDFYLLMTRIQAFVVNLAQAERADPAPMAAECKELVRDLALAHNMVYHARGTFERDQHRILQKIKWELKSKPLDTVDEVECTVDKILQHFPDYLNTHFFRREVLVKSVVTNFESLSATSLTAAEVQKLEHFFYVNLPQVLEEEREPFFTQDQLAKQLLAHADNAEGVSPQLLKRVKQHGFPNSCILAMNLKANIDSFNRWCYDGDEEMDRLLDDWTVLQAHFFLNTKYHPIRHLCSKEERDEFILSLSMWKVMGVEPRSVDVDVPRLLAVPDEDVGKFLEVLYARIASHSRTLAASQSGEMLVNTLYEQLRRAVIEDGIEIEDTNALAKHLGENTELQDFLELLKKDKGKVGWLPSWVSGVTAGVSSFIRMQGPLLAAYSKLKEEWDSGSLGNSKPHIPEILHPQGDEPRAGNMQIAPGVALEWSVVKRGSTNTPDGQDAFNQLVEVKSKALLSLAGEDASVVLGAFEVLKSQLGLNADPELLASVKAKMDEALNRAAEVDQQKQLKLREATEVKNAEEEEHAGLVKFYDDRAKEFHDAAVEELADFLEPLFYTPARMFKMADQVWGGLRDCPKNTTELQKILSVTDLMFEDEECLKTLARRHMSHLIEVVEDSDDVAQEPSTDKREEEDESAVGDGHMMQRTGRKDAVQQDSNSVDDNDDDERQWTDDETERNTEVDSAASEVLSKTVKEEGGDHSGEEYESDEELHLVEGAQETEKDFRVVGLKISSNIPIWKSTVRDIMLMEEGENEEDSDDEIDSDGEETGEDGGEEIVSQEGEETDGNGKEKVDKGGGKKDEEGGEKDEEEEDEDNGDGSILSAQGTMNGFTAFEFLQPYFGQPWDRWMRPFVYIMHDKVRRKALVDALESCTCFETERFGALILIGSKLGFFRSSYYDEFRDGVPKDAVPGFDQIERLAAMSYEGAPPLRELQKKIETLKMEYMVATNVEDFLAGKTSRPPKGKGLVWNVIEEAAVNGVEQGSGAGSALEPTLRLEANEGKGLEGQVPGVISGVEERTEEGGSAETGGMTTEDGELANGAISGSGSDKEEEEEVEGPAEQAEGGLESEDESEVEVREVASEDPETEAEIRERPRAPDLDGAEKDEKQAVEQVPRDSSKKVAGLQQEMEQLKAQMAKLLEEVERERGSGDGAEEASKQLEGEVKNGSVGFKRVACPKCGVRRWKSQESPLYQQHVAVCPGRETSSPEASLSRSAEALRYKPARENAAPGLAGQTTFVREGSQEGSSSDSPAGTPGGWRELPGSRPRENEQVTAGRRLLASERRLKGRPVDRKGGSKGKLLQDVLMRKEKMKDASVSPNGWGTLVPSGKLAGTAGKQKAKRESRDPAVLQNGKPVTESVLPDGVRRPGARVKRIDRPQGDYYYIVDTNILMNAQFREHMDDIGETMAPSKSVRATFVVPSIVFKELDRLKSRKPGTDWKGKKHTEEDGQRAASALTWYEGHLRRKSKWIHAATRDEYISPHPTRALDNEDDGILGVAMFFHTKYPGRAYLVTKDRSMKLKAQNHCGLLILGSALFIQLEGNPRPLNTALQGTSA